MLKTSSQKNNRHWWETQVRSKVDRYTVHLATKTIAEDFIACDSLQQCADTYATEAFYLLTADQDRLAYQLADRAIIAANEALQSESFERMFRRVKLLVADDPDTYVDDESFQPTSKQLHIQKTVGKMKTLRALQYAMWFKTGERPLELLREVTQLHQQYYDLYSRQFGKCAVNDLIRDYTEAGFFVDTIDLFEEELGKTKPSNKERHSDHNVAYTMCRLSEYALGNQDISSIVSKMVDHWYKRSTQWYITDWSLPWDMQLTWAYLRAKHFTGVTELRPLLDDLRGY